MLAGASSRASRAAAGRTAWRCSAARRPRCPASTRPGDYDVAGTIVGVVEREKILDGSRVRAGRRRARPAVGGPPHQRLLARPQGPLRDGWASGRRTGCPSSAADRSRDALLAPHLSYLRGARAAARRRTSCTAMAHITGGGFYDNIPRVLPQGLDVVVKSGAWPVPAGLRGHRSAKATSPSRRCTASSTWESAWSSSSPPEISRESPRSGRTPASAGSRSATSRRPPPRRRRARRPPSGRAAPVAHGREETGVVLMGPRGGGFRKLAAVFVASRLALRRGLVALRYFRSTPTTVTTTRPSRSRRAGRAAPGTAGRAGPGAAAGVRARGSARRGWARWDGLWYARIAERGYAATFDVDD